MTAPASVHEHTRRLATLIIEREYAPDPARCVKAIIALLTYRPPATTDTADHGRRLAGGAHPMQHEDRACALQDVDAAFMEDGRHEQSTDN